MDASDVEGYIGAKFFDFCEFSIKYLEFLHFE